MMSARDHNPHRYRDSYFGFHTFEITTLAVHRQMSGSQSDKSKPQMRWMIPDDFSSQRSLRHAGPAKVPDRSVTS